MVGDLVMLPVRIGVRVTRVWFRALEETVSATTGATGRVVELLASRSPNGAGRETLPDDPTTDAEQPRSEPTGDERPSRSEEPHDAADSSPPVRELRSLSAVEAPAPPREAEPVHVSEEPVLVEEFAEPGAEQGAGAEVHVDQPWDGYEQMNAKQIIGRLAEADPSELAAVQLYEGANRHRQTVMNAVQRELRTKTTNTGNSRANQRR